MKPIEINALLGIECGRGESDNTLAISNVIVADPLDCTSISDDFFELPFSTEFGSISPSSSVSSGNGDALSLDVPQGDDEIAATVATAPVADSSWLWDTTSGNGFPESASNPGFASIGSYESISNVGDGDTVSVITATSQSSFTASCSSFSDIHDDDVHMDTTPATPTILDALRASPPRTTSPATTPNLSDFTLLEQLGKGAFGTVFLANHRPSGVRVALKAISKAPSRKASGRYLGDTEYEQATGFLRDAVLQEFFAFHRTRDEKMVLQIQAAFHDPSYFYIATVSFSLLQVYFNADRRTHVDLPPRRRLTDPLRSTRIPPRRSCTILRRRSRKSHSRHHPHSVIC